MCDFLFLDDCTLNAVSDPKNETEYRSVTHAKFGLTINTNKMDILYQLALYHLYEHLFTASGIIVNAVDKFTNIGRDVHIHGEGDVCIFRASSVFRRL